jgi:hypothetical protein
MLQSDDPVYQTAVDMMLLGGLAEICRAYYQIHQLIWAGQKDAVRFLEEHAPAFLALFRKAIHTPDRVEKGQLYQQLVSDILAPVGGLWEEEGTKIFLRDDTQHPEGVEIAQAYWQGLVRPQNTL